MNMSQEMTDGKKQQVIKQKIGVRDMGQNRRENFIFWKKAEKGI